MYSIHMLESIFCILYNCNILYIEMYNIQNVLFIICIIYISVYVIYWNYVIYSILLEYIL